jgi:DNA modification methylase
MKVASGSGWTMRLGNCAEIMPTLDRVDHVITDPPYSEHVHSKSMRGASLPDTAEFACRFKRKKELGFEALSPELRSLCAREFARLAKRWVLTFCNVEMAHEWAADLVQEKLDYVRTMAWVKLGATPQFTGDRPAAGFEAMVLAHPKGRKRWNGGGKQGIYTVPIEANRLGNRGARVHTTQKPLALMLQLVEDFTDPGELVLDAFAGSATTGAACLRLGRRFVGIEKEEKYFELSCERLRAEERGSTLQAQRSGQGALFGGAT